MREVSRRGLFGLLAGAAAAPMMKAAVPDLMLGGTPIFYDWKLIPLDPWNEIRGYVWGDGTTGGDGLVLLADENLRRSS